MKRTITRKEMQCLFNAISKKLAYSVHSRAIYKYLVSEEQILETEANYACFVLDVSLLLNATPKERAEILYDWYLNYKNDIVVDVNILSLEDCHRVRGRLEAIQWFYGEVVKLLEIKEAMQDKE